MRISIVMPAYNAGEWIRRTIGRVPRETGDALLSLWIVNDGSTDATRTLIEDAQRENGKIRVIHFPENRGYGSAVKAGLAQCKDEPCDIAVCLHADGQYPPEKIPEFTRFMRERSVDLLQGSRIASGTALSGGMPLYKYLANRCLTFFENIVYGLSLTDYHSGYLCYSRLALDTILFERLSASFDFDLEVIACARARGLKIAELPVPTRYAGEKSHVKSIGYGLRAVKVMGRYMIGKYRISNR